MYSNQFRLKIVVCADVSVLLGLKRKVNKYSADLLEQRCPYHLFLSSAKNENKKRSREKIKLEFVLIFKWRISNAISLSIWKHSRVSDMIDFSNGTTGRSSFPCDNLAERYIVLHRLAAPGCWLDLEPIFRTSITNLPEVFGRELNNLLKLGSI